MNTVHYKMIRGTFLLVFLQSTLLQCLLRELLPLSGEVTVKGVIAYASQQPWIFSSTLRENILFGKPFQPQWYNRVIDACALDIVSFYIQSIYSNLTLATSMLV